MTKSTEELMVDILSKRHPKRSPVVLKAEPIEDPAKLAIHVFNKYIKQKMLFPAGGHFDNPNQAKMWFADQAGKFGMDDLKEQALDAKSFDDIQALGENVLNDQTLVDRIINGIALGMTDKQRAREWNPVMQPPRPVFGGRIAEGSAPRDIEGELKNRGQWDSRGGGSASTGYGQGAVGVGKTAPTAGAGGQGLKSPQTTPTSLPQQGAQPTQQPQGGPSAGQQPQGGGMQVPDPQVSELDDEGRVEDVNKYFPSNTVPPPTPDMLSGGDGFMSSNMVSKLMPDWLKKLIFGK